jgi:hypothetical protein
VLGFLLSSLSKEVLPRVATSATTAATAWKEIETMFSSHTRARIVNTRLQLVTTQKGHLSVAEYINKMKSLAEEMVTAGRPLEDVELIEYILVGLNQDYDPIAPAIIAHTEPASLSELYSQLLAFETRHALMDAHEGDASFANAAHRGRGHGGCGSFG